MLAKIIQKSHRALKEKELVKIIAEKYRLGETAQKEILELRTLTMQDE